MRSTLYIYRIDPPLPLSQYLKLKKCSCTPWRHNRTLISNESLLLSTYFIIPRPRFLFLGSLLHLQGSQGQRLAAVQFTLITLNRLPRRPPARLIATQSLSILPLFTS